MLLNIILYILAAGCFAVAAWGGRGERTMWIAFGLLAWVLVPLIAALT